MSTTNPAARRRLLKCLTAAGGIAVTANQLPRRWTRPVVDAVLLPAHAQTSQACGEVECDLAISMRFSTNDDDWDLVIALNGNSLSGKGGNVACLVHSGDRTPPGDSQTSESFRETITNPSGLLAVGNYRVFARLAGSETAPSNQSLQGTVSTCNTSDNFTLFPSNFSIGDTQTIANLEVTAGGSVNLLL